MTVCVANGCQNRTGRQKKKGVTFHKFPRKEEKKQQWIKALNRENFTPSKYSTLCSEHFNEKDIDRTSLSCVRLREGAVPTIFNSLPRRLKSWKKRRRPKKAPPTERNPDQDSVCATPTPMSPYDENETEAPTGNMDSPEQTDLKHCFCKPHNMAAAPSITTDAVFVESVEMPEGSEVVKGYDFNEGVDYHKLFLSMSTTGFQATAVGKAITEINRMIDCKLKAVPDDKKVLTDLNPCGREFSNCSIFLSYTSNLISAGTREVIRYVVEHNMVDCLVTTAGGIEEDFIKCLAPTYLGDFALSGRELRSKGINRIGNLLAPNKNYCLFEDWLMPVLDKMLEEQKAGTLWTPSKFIARLGKEIDNPESVYYWAYKNNIPVFCPALTDGSIGDMLFLHTYQNPGLVIDLVQDIRCINKQAVHAVNSGMIILGGGVVKHHTCNANLMRNGADFSVYVNTANEFDGSDSGARPDEAISWGKIKVTANPVKIYGEASVIFPILVAESFARREKEFKDFGFTKTD